MNLMTINKTDCYDNLRKNVGKKCRVFTSIIEFDGYQRKDPLLLGNEYLKLPPFIADIYFNDSSQEDLEEDEIDGLYLVKHTYPCWTRSFNEGVDDDVNFLHQGILKIEII